MLSILALAFVLAAALWWGLRSLVAHHLRHIPWAAAVFVVAATALVWLSVSPRAVTHLPPATPYAAGVALRPNWSAVQAESVAGAPLLADAAATPLLFVAPTPADAAVAQAVMRTLAALRAYRPVVLVGTHFPAPDAARIVWQHWLHRFHIVLPGVIQQGPPTWYTTTVPLLVVQWDGHLRRIDGSAAIVQWLHAHDGLRLPPPVHRPAAKS